MVGGGGGMRRGGLLQWLPGYLGRALVFVWGGAGFLLLVLAKLSFWRGDWALGFCAVGFRHFTDVS